MMNVSKALGRTSLDAPGSAKAVFKNWLLTFCPSHPADFRCKARVHEKSVAHVNF
jgi:hypothetical protein